MTGISHHYFSQTFNGSTTTIDSRIMHRHSSHRLLADDRGCELDLDTGHYRCCSSAYVNIDSMCMWLTEARVCRHLWSLDIGEIGQIIEGSWMVDHGAFVLHTTIGWQVVAVYFNFVNGTVWKECIETSDERSYLSVSMHPSTIRGIVVAHSVPTIGYSVKYKECSSCAWNERSYQTSSPVVEIKPSMDTHCPGLIVSTNNTVSYIRIIQFGPDTVSTNIHLLNFKGTLLSGCTSFGQTYFTDGTDLYFTRQSDFVQKLNMGSTAPILKLTCIWQQSMSIHYATGVISIFDLYREFNGISELRLRRSKKLQVAADGEIEDWNMQMTATGYLMIRRLVPSGKISGSTDVVRSEGLPFCLKDLLQENQNLLLNLKFLQQSFSGTSEDSLSLTWRYEAVPTRGTEVYLDPKELKSSGPFLVESSTRIEGHVLSLKFTKGSKVI